MRSPLKFALIAGLLIFAGATVVLYQKNHQTNQTLAAVQAEDEETRGRYAEAIGSIAAIQDSLPIECWILLAANVFYSFAYDTVYAMVDREDDRRIGVRSSAIALGDRDVAAVMASYAAMLATLAGVGWYLSLGWPFYAGLALAGAWAAFQYPLIRGRTREGCWRAFVHSNWIGAAVLAGVVLESRLA